MWYIYTIEHYSDIRRRKIVPLSTTCMGLEGIMLSEISQTDKDEYQIISIVWGV